MAGLVLIPWFWVANGVTALRTDSPPSDAPAGDFVDYYAENLSRLPLRATAFTLQWVIVLVLVVAVLRAADRRRSLAATIATALAGAATAVYVATEGLGVWPALAPEVTASNLGADLTPAVAQALVSSRDGLHGIAAVVLGASLVAAAWVLFRSSLWGHTAMGVLTALTGLGSIASMIAGPESVAPGLAVLWAPVVSVLLLIARHRLADGPDRSPSPV